MHFLLSELSAISMLSESFVAATVSSAPAASGTVMGFAFMYVWHAARGYQGIRAWTHRVALEKLDDLRGRERPLDKLCLVERERWRRTRGVVAFFVSGVTATGLAFLCSMLHAGAVVWLDNLLLAACVGAFAAWVVASVEVVWDVWRRGAPHREIDENRVSELSKQLHLEVTADLQREPLVPEPSTPCSSDVADSKVIITTRAERILIATPQLFREVLRDRMRDCMDSFQPKNFAREHQCVAHLEQELDTIVNSEERSKVDILALCVDKTQGADYVQSYWRKNLEGARAGVYISRVFVYEPSTKDSVEKVAREQLAAGIHATMISRVVLESFLHDTYQLGVFGFTVVQGVPGHDQVVLHSGVGDTVTAALFEKSPLTGYFAGIHAAIRRKVEPLRPLRPERDLDLDRTLLQLEVRGTQLDAVRLDYGLTREGRKAMSVAFDRRKSGRQLTKNETVLVSSGTLGLENKPMRISHYHDVDTVVCSRRLHRSCRSARDSDYVVGLCEVA